MRGGVVVWLSFARSPVRLSADGAGAAGRAWSCWFCPGDGALQSWGCCVALILYDLYDLIVYLLRAQDVQSGSDSYNVLNGV